MRRHISAHRILFYKEDPDCFTWATYAFPSAAIVTYPSLATPVLAVTLTVTTLLLTVAVIQFSVVVAVTAPVDVAVMVFPTASEALSNDREVGVTVRLLFLSGKQYYRQKNYPMSHLQFL